MHCQEQSRLDCRVDLSIGNTLEQVIEEDPTTRFITLPCSHTLSIETLDGHAQINDYYHQSAEGKWVSITEPKHGFTERPTCPNCRGPIDARRYNRINKRALIDIQEQRAIEDLSHRVAHLRQEVTSANVQSMVDKSKHRMGNQKTGRAPRPISPRLNAALRLNPIDTQCIGFAMFEEDIAG